METNIKKNWIYPTHKKNIVYTKLIKLPCTWKPTPIIIKSIAIN